MNFVENNDAFVINGTGRPLRQFIYSHDLAKLMIWCIRQYQEIKPILLSVDEKDEISIADVANLIVKEMNFTGVVKVLHFSLVYDPNLVIYIFSMIPMQRMVNTKKLREMQNFDVIYQISNLPHCMMLFVILFAGLTSIMNTFVNKVLPILTYFPLKDIFNCFIRCA